MCCHQLWGSLWHGVDSSHIWLALLITLLFSGSPVLPVCTPVSSAFLPLCSASLLLRWSLFSKLSSITALLISLQWLSMNLQLLPRPVHPPNAWSFATPNVRYPALHGSVLFTATFVNYGWLAFNLLLCRLDWQPPVFPFMSSTKPVLGMCFLIWDLCNWEHSILISTSSTLRTNEQWATQKITGLN